MKRSFLILLIPVFSFCLFANPVKYNPDCGLKPYEFFEKEYRQLWEALSEEEQFAIAASANVFERNEQYHLDFSNKEVFDKDTTTGKYILNQRWDIYTKEQLLANDKDIEENGQAPVYRKLEALLLKYPDSSIIEIGLKEELTVTQVSRLYLIQALRPFLGIHGIDAWDDSRRINILRWGMSAGYISKEEGLEIIKPLVDRIKNNYCSFEDYFSHWMAGYCYNEVFNSTCPQCVLDVIDALNSARAYVPFELMKFSGQNADPSHVMTYEEGIYTPSDLAYKLVPVQKVFKRYWNEKPADDILQDLIKEENNYPEIADLTLYCHLDLMRSLSTSAERIEYIESKEAFWKNLGEASEWYNYVLETYLFDLLKVYSPQKVIDLYKSLPAKVQAKEDLYFDYGYANYQMISICSTIMERDIYISRAREVFVRLKARNYNIGERMDSWLKMMESL